VRTRQKAPEERRAFVLPRPLDEGGLLCAWAVATAAPVRDTEQFDRPFAANGLLYTQWATPTAMCSPTRSCWLGPGRNPHAQNKAWA